MFEELKKINCSFCQRKKEEVNKLIAGKNNFGEISFICDKCTELCYKSLKNNEEKKFQEYNILTPIEIYDQLCEFVEGQEDAKRVLSVAIYNRSKYFLNHLEEGMTLPKSNILLIGPTGSGKTFLIEKVAELTKTPLVIADASQITSVGYVGRDVSDLIRDLFQKSGNDKDRTERGIIYIDEFDKLQSNSDEQRKFNDISGARVQQELLKIIEGTDVSININDKKIPGASRQITIKTDKILFIFGGSFIGLEKIIEKDLRKSSIGFGSVNIDIDDTNKYEELMKNLNSEHLKKYGIIPELIGRIPVRVFLKELTTSDLISILKDKKNSILKQYKNLFYIKDHANLTWTDAAVKLIAEKAVHSKLGARDLKSTIEKILNPIMFQIPSMKKGIKVCINEDCVIHSIPPVIENI